MIRTSTVLLVDCIQPPHLKWSLRRLLCSSTFRPQAGISHFHCHMCGSLSCEASMYFPARLGPGSSPGRAESQLASERGELPLLGHRRAAEATAAVVCSHSHCGAAHVGRRALQVQSAGAASSAAPPPPLRPQLMSIRQPLGGGRRSVSLLLSVCHRRLSLSLCCARRSACAVCKTERVRGGLCRRVLRTSIA